MIIAVIVPITYEQEKEYQMLKLYTIKLMDGSENLFYLAYGMPQSRTSRRAASNTISNYFEIGTFELYNALGQIILSHSLNSQESQKIVLPKLSNGMYSYKILGKNKTHFGKLNIQQNE